jgi:hypothetical protein
MMTAGQRALPLGSDNKKAPIAEGFFVHCQIFTGQGSARFGLAITVSLSWLVALQGQALQGLALLVHQLRVQLPLVALQVPELRPRALLAVLQVPELAQLPSWLAALLLGCNSSCRDSMRRPEQPEQQ